MLAVCRARTGAGFALSIFALACAASDTAQAYDPLRIPSLAWATDGELDLDRTGFILSPDWAINDQVNLNGSGGSLLKDTSGISIGGKFGYDYYANNILVGFITDAFYSFADGKGRGAGAGIYKSELNYYGTVRGKLGVGLGRWLPYATAGYAYGGLEVKDITTGAKSSQGLNGWTYGGGLEYVWNNDLTVNVGYRRIDFDKETFSVLPVGQRSITPHMDVIDFGFVRRF